jgi:hypothetical protein
VYSLSFYAHLSRPTLQIVLSCQSFSRLSCPDCPVRLVLSQMSYLKYQNCPKPSCTVLAVLSLLLWPGCSACLFYPGYTVPSLHSGCPVLSVLARLSCPGCLVSAVLSKLPNTLVSAVLPRLSYSSCSAMVPLSTALLILLSCPGNPVLSVLSRITDQG